MNVGKDLRLENHDILFTADGDVELISGGPLIAQDIAEEIALERGSIPWAKDAGSDITLALNDARKVDTFVVSELKRLAWNDDRIDARTVQARTKTPGHYCLQFNALGSLTQETLLFDLTFLKEKL